MFCILLFLHNSAFCQLSTEDVRPIDSTFANQWLLSPTIHTHNIHSLPDGFVIMTWDAGNGLYKGIPDYAVAWSHTDKVSADTAALLNSVAGQAYISFDLNHIPSIEGYADSLASWFSSIGIPVLAMEFNEKQFGIFPNPANHVIQLTAAINPGNYLIEVFDVYGNLIEALNGSGEQNVLRHIIDVGHYPTGMYFLRLNETHWSTKLIISR